MASERPGLNGEPHAEHGQPVYLAAVRYSDLDGAVAAAFDRFRLPLSGATVLVKPNMLGPYPPERGVTTHPSLVSAVVRYLLDAGARPVVGDNPGARGYGVSLQCGHVTGIAAASHGCFVNLGERSIEVPLDSEVTDRVRVSPEVVEADLVVSLPKLKTHVQTIMTGGVKNSYGFLVGAEKSRLHSLARTPRAFARILAGVFLIRPPDLTLMDAVTVMQGDGPSSGSLRSVGMLVASSDTLAVDHLAAAIMGLDPARVLHLAEVARLRPRWGSTEGAGPARADAPDDFKLPISLASGLKSYLANWIVFSFLKKSRLRVDAAACTGCAACREGCPVKAITMSGGRPVIDRDACIACYCCHELCPSSAMQLDPALRALLRVGL